MSKSSSLPNELIANYAYFNAVRSLGNSKPSECKMYNFGSAIAIVDPARPGSAMCNRVLGYSEKNLSHLREILSLFEEAGEEPRFEISSDHLFPEVVQSLIENDISAAEAVTYLNVAPNKVDTNTPIAAAIQIKQWQHERADDFLELLKSSGVKCKPEVWDDRRQYYCTDTFGTFVASCDGQPCAWATMYVEEPLGFLANAFTLPDYRNRGCHLALVCARIADAIDLGLERVYTDVVAGSQSHQNCRRAGFDDQTVVTLWKREK